MFTYRLLTRDARRNSILTREQEENDRIISTVKNDIKAVDLKISLYIAACSTLHHTCIHPSPPILSGPNRIENVRVLAQNDSIPPPEALLTYLDNFRGSPLLSKQAFSILKWLTVGLKEPKIIYVEPEKYNDILEIEENAGNEGINLPESVFALRYREMSIIGQDWTSRTAGRRTVRFFLPCQVENLHCLIYRGMASNNVGPDGSLIFYKSLDRCLTATKESWTWGKSCVGTRLKIVAIADVVESRLKKVDPFEGGMTEVEGNTYKLAELPFYRPKYLLVYPQEKKHTVTTIFRLPIRRTGLQSMVIVTWGIIIILACILPTLNKNEEPKLLSYH